MGVTLTTNQLAQLRLHQEGSLPDTCTLQVLTVGADAIGGQTLTWANTHTNVECRLAPIRSRQEERIVGEQQIPENLYMLTVHHDQTITTKMRCIHDSVTYEIRALHDTHSQRTGKRAILVKLENA
jgi:SPP1 family predicted phage head-tail adaptor